MGEMDDGARHGSATRVSGDQPAGAMAAALARAADDLIRRAGDHPLGEPFLTDGALDSVCAAFGVHAFVVDVARDVLAERDLSVVTSPLSALGSAALRS